MNTIMIVICALIGVAIVLGLSYIFIYNRLQKYTVRISEAENEIRVTLKKRYEVLRNMEEEINKCTKLNQNNFKDFKDIDKMNTIDLDRQLYKVMVTFEKIKEDYPEKLDNEHFRELSTEVKIVDEKCVAVKAYYNKYISSLNLLIKKFPSNIVSRIHGIKEGSYYDNKNLKYKEMLDFKL